MSGGRRAFRKFLATTVATSLALGSPTLFGGCSFVAVQAPRTDDHGRLEPAGCTTRMITPAVDGALTAGSLAGTILLTAGSANESSNGLMQNNNDQIMFGGVVLAVLFGISAIYGAVTVSNCRVASGMRTEPKATSDERRSQRRADEAAEEAAVQARLKAKAAANANAAAGAATDAGAPLDGSAPASAPNQKRDDER